MSSNIVATGEYTWTSSGILDGNDGVDTGTNNANNDVVNFEEGSGENDNSQLIGGVNMTSSGNTRSGEKRKEKDAYKVRAKKKNTSGIVIQLLLRMDQPLEIMLTRSGSTSLHMDLKGCSIREVMGELHSIPGVIIASDFHDFATEYLSSRRKREMWSTMGGPEKKLIWLKRMYARSKHG